MKLTPANKTLIENMINHVMVHSGSASINVKASYGPILLMYFRGLKRAAAEESLYVLPQDDPFFGYGELSLLDGNVIMPDPPEFSKTYTPAEQKALFLHWRHGVNCELRIWQTPEICGTNAMHLFRATRHKVILPDTKLSVMHSEKWRVKKRAKYLATKVAVENVLVYRHTEVIDGMAHARGLVLEPMSNQIKFDTGD
jgi:hypothetical protein